MNVPTQVRRSTLGLSDFLTPNAPPSRINPVGDLVPSSIANARIVRQRDDLATLASSIAGVSHHRTLEYMAPPSCHLDTFDLLLSSGLYSIQDLPDSFTVVHQSALRSVLLELGL